MCGYQTYQDPRLQPTEEPDTDAVECLQRCAHGGACERIYRRCIDARRKFGWLEDMARFLACDRCDAYEEGE